MTDDLELRLRHELQDRAATTTATPDAYARIIELATERAVERPRTRPWPRRIAVLAAVAVLVTGAVVLALHREGDGRPEVATQPPAGPPLLTGLVTAAVETIPCDGDCISSVVTFDLAAPGQLTTLPTEGWSGVEVLPDGRYLIPGGDGQRASLVSPDGETSDLGPGYVQSVRVAPGGGLVMLALPGGPGRPVLRTVDPSSGAIENQALPKWMLAEALDIATDGTVVVLGDRDECCLNKPRLLVFPPGGSPREVDLGDALQGLESFPSPIGIALSPQGLVAISERTPAPLSRGGVAHPGWTVVVDQDGRSVATLNGWQGLAWSPDGSGLLSAQRSGERSVDLRVWFGPGLAQHIDVGSTPLPLTPFDWVSAPVGPDVEVSAPGDGPVVYLLGPNAFRAGGLRFDELVRQSADAAPTGPAERITAALRAASTPNERQVAAQLRAPLSEETVPTVTIDGHLAILDWDPDATQPDLGIWSTATGSTGLNPILGMVFDNAPDVQTVELRLDGSCEGFTERMQGLGCQHYLRSGWEAYKATQ